MTYDNWKTTEPDNEPFEVCDKCGRRCGIKDMWFAPINAPELWCEECCQKHEREHGPRETGDAWTGGFAENH